MIKGKIIEKVPISVGQEFVEWAQKFWALEKFYLESGNKDGSESISFDAMKGAWVSKINSIIVKRINDI